MYCLLVHVQNGEALRLSWRRLKSLRMAGLGWESGGEPSCCTYAGNIMPWFLFLRFLDLVLFIHFSYFCSSSGTLLSSQWSSRCPTSRIPGPMNIPPPSFPPGVPHPLVPSYGQAFNPMQMPPGTAILVTQCY